MLCLVSPFPLVTPTDSYCGFMEMTVRGDRTVIANPRWVVEAFHNQWKRLKAGMRHCVEGHCRERHWEPTGIAAINGSRRKTRTRRSSGVRLKTSSY